MRKSLIVSFVFGCIAVLLLQPMAVLAQNGEKTEVSTTIEGNDQYDSWEKVALVQNPNEVSNVWVTGNKPGTFTIVDNENNSLTSPVDCYDEIQYPQFLGTNAYFTTNVVNPWDQVTWLHLDNNSKTVLTGENPTFNVSMTTEVLGSMNPGSETTFQIPIPSEYYNLLEIEINNPGFYIFYQDHDDVSGPVMISPDNYIVSTQSITLPRVSQFGNRIKTAFLFHADVTGTFRYYFVPESNFLSFEIRKYDVQSSLNFGNSIQYQSEDFDEVDAGNLQGVGEGLPVQIYSAELDAGQIFRYNCEYIWGDDTSANTLIAIPTEEGYSFTALDADGDDHYIMNQMDGKVYFILIYEDYYYWDGSTPVREMFYYNLFIDLIETKSYNIGSEQLLRVSREEMLVSYTFTINETSLIGFNDTIIAGSPESNLDTQPDNFFVYADTEGKLESVDQSLVLDGEHIYYMKPGRYYFFCEHSGVGLNDEYLEMKSTIADIGGSVNHFSLMKNEPGPNPSQKTRVTSSFSNHDTPDGSWMKPIALNFTYENPVGFKHNITALRSDNSNFENYPIRFSVRYTYYHLSRYDDSTFFRSTGVWVTSNINLGIGEEETNPVISQLSVDGSNYIPGNGSGVFVLWPYDVQIDEGSGFVSYNHSVSFRIGTEDTQNLWKSVTLNTPHEVNRPLQPTMDYNTMYFPLTGTFNLTEYSGLIVDVNGSQMFDWWQIITSFNQTGAASTWIALLYDNPWTSIETIGYSNKNYLSSASSVQNHTFEEGIAPKNFKLYIHVSDPLSEVIAYKLRISEYNVEILPSPITYDPSGPGLGARLRNLPTWSYYVGGGGVLLIIAGVVGYSIYKKKNPV